MAKSTVKKKTLNPLYCERFALPVHESEVDVATVELKVFDYDLVGDDDFMCQIVPVPVESLTRKWTKKGWYQLTDADGAVKPNDPLGEIELAFRIHHNPALVEPPLIPEGPEAELESEEMLAKEPNEVHDVIV